MFKGFCLFSCFKTLSLFTWEMPLTRHGNNDDHHEHDDDHHDYNDDNHDYDQDHDHDYDYGSP